jgi:predicted nucleic acid-binding Zn finger protein
MVLMEELKELTRILDEINSQGKVSRHNWLRLQKLFGNRFLKAWGLVSGGRIKRYIFRPSQRKIWIAVGHGGEYIIYPHAGYCSCNDFYFRVLDREEGLCYHLLAQKIAKILGAYREVLEEDEFYPLLMEEWLREAVED